MVKDRQTQTGTVLLVDDEPVILRMHAAGVRQFGFDALLAENFDEALTSIKNHKIDLIISDVQMPGKGGFDLAQEVNVIAKKATPFLFLTGYDDLEIIRQGLKVGGDDFIIKGKPIDVLRKRVAFWMASGFQKLPDDIRRRALGSANRIQGDALNSVDTLIADERAVVHEALQRLRLELDFLPVSYGQKLVERICILGRGSKLVIDACASVGDYIRFPDYVYHTVAALGQPWSSDLAPLLKYFDTFVLDPRFLEAGVKPLMEIGHYDWFQKNQG